MPVVPGPADNVFLMSGDRNNFPAWRTIIVIDAREAFGHAGTLCETGEKWVVPAVVASDYTPMEVLEAGAAVLPAAALMRFRESAISNRMKEVRKNEEKQANLFAFIWLRLSPDSAMTVSAHENYDEAFTASDATALWTIIVETHLTHVNGQSPALLALTKADEISKFNNLGQKPRETIGDFLKRLKDAYVVLVASGVDEFTDQEKAIHLLTKLDQVRHGAMLASLRNDARKNIPLPATLYDAYMLASTYLVKIQQGPIQVKIMLYI